MTLKKNCTEVYNYDNGGKILSIITYPLTWGSLNGVTATQTINYAYRDTNRKDKLTSYSSTAITYYSIGNPLSYDYLTGVACLGATGAHTATIGCLAFNAEAIIFALFYGVELEPIDWDYGY